MSRLMLAVLSAFIFLLKLTAGQHLDGSITATECVEAFELLQLDFEDFTRFPKYFNENSTMYVAQTGIYHGVDGIEEYIRFVSKSNPYITERDTVAVSPMKLHGFDPVEETCSFSLHRAIRLETNPEMAVEGTVVFAIFTLVEFDYRQNVISTVHTGFKKDSVDLLFGVILNTEGVRNHICDVSGSSLCNETNVGMTHEQCMENLWELPAMTNGDRLDGDSVGCRAIHAILSEWDSRHCPHISFEPQADYQGKVKCQTTIGLQEEDLFDDNFMQEYDDFLDEVFGTTESSYKILSLPKETNKTRELIFGLVVPMVVFVVVFGVIKFTQAKYEKVAESDEPKLLANKASQLSKIIFTWIGVLVVANGLCYLVIWAVSRSNPDWDWTVDYQEVLLSETVDLQNRYHGSPVSFSDTVPFAIMNNDQFRVYTGFIVWITCLIVGLGLEIFVWYHFLQVWCKERELVWRFVQFIFPLLLVVALGAASQGNFFALPVTVLGLWKFGFPETLMYFYLALFGTTLGHTRRLADFLNGAGTVIHHGAASFIIAMLLVGVIPPTKYVYHSTLILVIQHWMTILSYVNKALYAAIVLVVEYYFEWTIFSDFRELYHMHWTAALGAGVMVFAHWLYILSAAVDMLHSTDDDENVHERGQAMMSKNSRDPSPDSNTIHSLNQRIVTRLSITGEVGTLSSSMTSTGNPRKRRNSHRQRRSSCSVSLAQDFIHQLEHEIITWGGGTIPEAEEFKNPDTEISQTQLTEESDVEQDLT